MNIQSIASLLRNTLVFIGGCKWQNMKYSQYCITNTK
jgi:hypothetical protein